MDNTNPTQSKTKSSTTSGTDASDSNLRDHTEHCGQAKIENDQEESKVNIIISKKDEDELKIKSESLSSIESPNSDKEMKIVEEE